VEVIVCYFVPYKKKDQSTKSNSDRQSENIDEGIKFLLDKIPESNLDIISKH
jgi:hypothetical protein